MNFRTEIKLERLPVDRQIDYKKQLFLIGSCFSDNVGKLLKNFGFSAINNPFGTLYNPFSICQNLDRLLQNIPFDDEDLIFSNGLWHSMSHHSFFSSEDKELCLQNINKQFSIAQDSLLNADFLFITFGSAWVFRWKESGEVVANCHKIPSKEFIREKLSVECIVKRVEHTIQLLRQKNPTIKIVFSVSPIRHLGDGLHENQLSKSTLLLAVDELCKQQNTTYFPSYEMILDDLRDYRFFSDDMSHPSSFAVDYIWQKFSDCFFSEPTKQLLLRVEKLRKSLDHRPLNPNYKEYEKFLLALETEKEYLIKQGIVI
ncbi:MAG: GSCFA domain-containing protein [Paludibacteraceae bacterium]|nr:GSCFA domain-containing protein [Paludibacteraceae bacterium]